LLAILTKILTKELGYCAFKKLYFLPPDACHNKECPFLHIDPETKIRDCPWYDRGFCRHGPSCRHRHVRRVLCLNYLSGFCPAGSRCPDAHPK
jgi:cleavage and polyadenylation specificity factor subunit 4